MVRGEGLLERMCFAISVVILSRLVFVLGRGLVSLLCWRYVSKCFPHQSHFSPFERTPFASLLLPYPSCFLDIIPSLLLNLIIAFVGIPWAYPIPPHQTPSLPLIHYPASSSSLYLMPFLPITSRTQAFPSSHHLFNLPSILLLISLLRK
jgi:hypothetical protein